MQKYVITCFFLAVMTVNQVRTTAKKRKDREANNQTDKVAFISLLKGFKDHPNQESSYINLKDFNDGDIEVQNGRLTVVVPTSQIKGQRRKCKSIECIRHKEKSTIIPSNGTEIQSSLRNAIQHLKSKSGPIFIMKADDLKKDWCRTERMKRKVTEKGCVAKTIINHFCYGQCNSFFIPRQIRGKRNFGNFQSCAYCQPTNQRWITVTLHCPRLIPPIRKKRVLRVDKCSCSTGTSTVF